jgi:integrase/recombinase XerD
VGGPRFTGVTGPLAVFEAGFAAEMAATGYVPRVVQLQLRLMTELSGWLESQGLEAWDLSLEVAEAFMVVRRQAGQVRHVTVKCLLPLLGYLAGKGVIASAGSRMVEGPVEAILGRYGEYLRVERALGSGTIAGYVAAVRPFVAAHIGSAGGLGVLTAADVTRFIVKACPDRPPGPAKVIVTAMRSFLGWLHLEGTLAVPLSSAVPSVSSRRLVGLPDPLSVSQMRALLGVCDRRSRTGRRDYAMIVLLWRLGLRAGEVARLGLDDIDWQAGEIVVLGKGPKTERLPLPADVGEAIVGWLQRGRPATAVGRTVFVRVVAPHRQLSSGGVTQAVFAAGKRAGLGTVHAHRLRHSAASGMLAAGATLPEIGRVLRHRRTLTTAIYAKVDVSSLREVAAVWPGGSR